MRKTISFLMGLSLVLGITAQCFADPSRLYDHSPVSENYYIQPGGVFLAPNGIYASIDGVLIQINTLSADERGIFVPYGEIAGKLVKCPFCQRWYDPDSKVPHKCRGTPD